MKQAIQIQTVVNDAMVKDIPDLQPFLGHRVQMIALDLEPTNEVQEKKKLTFDEFLASRPEWPKDRPAVTLEEMEEAIIKGAIDNADL